MDEIRLLILNTFAKLQLHSSPKIRDQFKIIRIEVVQDYEHSLAKVIEEKLNFL
jgi:hypothetical protein